MIKRVLWSQNNAEKALSNFKIGVRVVRSACAIVFLLGALTACSFSSTGALPSPTLAATLFIAPSVSEIPSLTSTPELTVEIPTEVLPADTAAPVGNPTRTITAWANNTATAGPSPTPTRTATATRIPTHTLAPSRTPTITLTPTITFTPTPPPPLLYLVRPGLLSKVVSPIQLEFYATSGDDQRVTIELIGEDGRVISRQLINRDKDLPKRFWLARELPFEIDAAAETARLQISTSDSFGRQIALTSIDLILLSIGRNEINAPVIDQEPYLIRRPRPDQVVSGGILVIEALARPVNVSPLFIELSDETGRVISLKQVAVAPPSGPLSHTPFRVEIPYKVAAQTPVRLTIRQEGDRIPGTVALTSQLIVLEP